MLFRSGWPADKSGIPVFLSSFPLPPEHRPRVLCPRALEPRVSAHTTHAHVQGQDSLLQHGGQVTSSSEESAHLEHPLHQCLWAARMLTCRGSGGSCSHPDTRELRVSWQPLEALLWPNWPQGGQDFLLPTVQSCQGTVAVGGKGALN